MRLPDIAMTSQFGIYVCYFFYVCIPIVRSHGPLTRYLKLRVVHAPGMPGTFSLLTRLSDPDVHHGTCSVTHGACITQNFAYLAHDSDVFLMTSWHRKDFRIRTDSGFAPSQWEASLLSNTTSHWLRANLESALRITVLLPVTSGFSS